MTDKINDMFAIGPMLKPGEAMVGSKELLPNTPIQPPISENVFQDFQTSRTNVLEAIDVSRQVVSELSDIATASQDADHYDSLTSALKVMLEANRDLVDLQMKISKLTENLGGAIKQVQNNLFIGSTSDLQKFLEDMKKEKSE